MVLGGGNKPLRLLNTFLEECDVKTIIKPRIEWNHCVDRTKRRYIQHTRDIIVAVLKVVSPENAGYLWTALQASKAVNDELGVEGILLPTQRVYLEAIAETYKNASSWDTRRQILSIMSGTASLAATMLQTSKRWRRRISRMVVSLGFAWPCLIALGSLKVPHRNRKLLASVN